MLKLIDTQDRFLFKEKGSIRVDPVRIFVSEGGKGWGPGAQ